jgi:hypothetical protein
MAAYRTSDDPIREKGYTKREAEGEPILRLLMFLEKLKETRTHLEVMRQIFKAGGV